jgi:hemoglobin-like flavoprotein
MTQREILLIKSSWSIVATHPQESGNLFYGKLFELDPSLKSLFPEDMDPQANKLMKMLTYIIKHLQNLEDIAGEIQHLALRHAAYGAQPKHLATVGQALLYAIGEVNGNRWNQETYGAWEKVYGQLSATFNSALNKQPQLT